MTKTQPTHKKLPRAALFWLRETGGAFPLKSDKFPPDVPGAFIPCHTPAQAKQLVKAAEFLRLPEEEKVDKLARALHGGSWTFDVGPDDSRHVYYDNARAVLSAMGMGGASK